MRKITGYGLLLMMLGLAVACSSREGEAENAKTDPFAQYTSFTYTAEGIAQTLLLRWQNDSLLSFVLEQRQGACNYTLSGNAIKPMFGAMEDTDAETGKTYQAALYRYSQEGCRMVIRVAQDTSSVQLQISGCEAAPDCSMQSPGVLRRAR